MSADNALILLQNTLDESWNAYMVFASAIPTREELLKETPFMKFTALADAQKWAAEEMGREYYEYGAHICPESQPFPPPSLVEEKEEDTKAVTDAVYHAAQYEKLKTHIGHKIACVSYAKGLNLAIECEDCGTVLVDYDNPKL